MNIILYNNFRKEISRIKDKKLAIAVKLILETVKNAKDVAEIPHLKKLKGEKAAYRIRIGHHRIGVFIIKDTVEFAAFDHRKDIYKKFP